MPSIDDVIKLPIPPRKKPSSGEEAPPTPEPLTQSYVPSEPPPPLPPRTQPSVSHTDWSDVPANLAVNFSRGVLSGTAGLPANLLNLLSAGSGLVGGPHPHVPGDTEDINQLLYRLGIRKPEGPLSTMAGTVGEFMGPGVVGKAAEGIGQLPRAIERIKPFLSAGARSDAIMGAGAGIGGEVGELLEGKQGGQSGVGRSIGTAIGGVGAAGLHAAGSPVVRWLGKSIRVDQDIAEAATALRHAQDALKAGDRATAERLQDAVSHAKRLRAIHEGDIQQTQTGTVDPAHAFLTDVIRQGEEALTNVQHGTGVRTATAQADIDTAAQAGAQATQAQSEAFANLPGTVDATLGANLPTEKAAGAASQQAAESADVTRASAPIRAYRRLVDDIAPAIERDTIASQAATEVRPVFENKKKLVGQLFDAAENIAADDGPTMRRLWQTFQEMRAETSQTGQGMPRGSNTMERVITTEGLTESEQLLTDLQHRILDDPRQTAAQKQVARDAIGAIGTGAAPTQIPLWLARRMESSLDEMQRGGRPIGTLMEGRVRALLRAVRDDIYPWLSETHPTESTQLRHAKDAWKELLKDYNYSANRFLLDPSAKGDPRQWFDTLLRSTPHATDDLVLARKVLEPATWQTLKSSLLQHLFDAAAGGTGVESANQLRAVARNLQRNGKLQVLLDEPGQAERFLALVQDVSASQKGPEAKLAKALANKTPQQVSDFVFKPGDVGMTERYKSVTDSATYDGQVKAWARSLMEALPEMPPAKIVERLGPYLKKNGTDPSQLALMLEQYPGASAQIEAMVDTYRQQGSRAGQLQQAEAAARERLTGVTASGKEAEALQKTTTAQTVAEAQAALERAQATLARAQDFAKQSSMRQSRAQEQLRLTRRDELRPLQDAVEAAQTTLRDVREAHRFAPDEGVDYAHARMHQNNLVVRMGMGTGGIGSILAGIALQRPEAIAVGTAMAGYGFLFEPWTRTPAGRQAIRQGFTNQRGWTKKAGAFAASVLGTKRPPTPEQQPDLVVPAP